MSVKRRGDSWEARWREGGRNMSASFRTKKLADEAERVGRDRERGRRHGLPFEQGPITFDDLCGRYLEQHQASEVTLRTLRERLAYSRRSFGDVLVRELRAEEIARWNAALPVGPTTRGNALRAMRQVVAAGVEWGYLSTNPAKKVKLPKTPLPEVHPVRVVGGGRGGRCGYRGRRRG